MFETIAKWLISRADKRPPDYVIGGEDNPYLRRWWLIPRNPLLNFYLHQILRSDDDRALHDHPWVNCSIILRGRYLEVMPDRNVVRWPGSVTFRWPTAMHRLQLIDNQHCWTLFITGPRVRSWGFDCPQGWRHWREFTKPGAKGEIGRGCD